MHFTRDLPPALRALADTGIALARRAPSARVAEARTAALFPQVEWPLDAPEALDGRAVERILKSAWGRPPAKVLDAWDPEPIAVRPAAQVHRGELDGVAVAVKVLRPGLPATVRADLALLEALAGPLGSAFPALAVGDILAEVRETALDELDLESEGDQQRLLGRALRGVEDVTVPRVFGELTTEAVLVTERLDGPTLLDGAVPADPEALARRLVAAHLEAVRRAGLVPTDARPAHVVVLEDGLGLLGAGLARPWPAERLDGLLDALRALRDPEGADDLAAVAERLGLLPGDAARAGHAVARDVLGDLVDGPARLDLDALVAVGERALAHAGELAGLAAQGTPRPEDVSAFRAAGQLIATLAVLELETDWVELVLSAGS